MPAPLRQTPTTSVRKDLQRVTFLFTDKTQAVARIGFENLRNTGVCASLGVGGLVVLKYHELSLFGPALVPWISWGLIAGSAVLIMWNILLGFAQVTKELEPSPRVFGAVFLPCLLLYFIAATTFYGSIVKQAKHSMNDLPAATAAAPSQACTIAQAASAASPKP